MGAEPEECFDPVLWLKPGEHPDQIAGQMSTCSNLSFDAAKRLLLENNGGILRPAGLLFTGPRPLGDLRDHWLRERQEHEIACSLLDRPAREMFWDEPGALPQVGAFAEDAQMWGWRLPGKREAPETSLEGLLFSMMDAPVAVAARGLEDVRRAAERLYADVLRELGPKAFAIGSSVGAAQRLDEYVRRQPAYARLRAAIQRLPIFLRQRLGDLKGKPDREGAWFRRQFAVPWRGGARYTRHVATLLNGNLVALSRIGLMTSWVVPAVVALPDVYNAPNSYERGRIVFSKGVAIPIGVAVTGLLFRSAVYSAAVLILGPTGAFLVATAAVGWFAWKVGDRIERGATAVYDELAERFSPPALPAVQPLLFRGALR